jgi:hypothetical protein
MYGIRALNSCRARHYNLLRQRQRQSVRVGRRGQAIDEGNRDTDPDRDEAGKKGEGHSKGSDEVRVVHAGASPGQQESPWLLIGQEPSARMGGSDAGPRLGGRHRRCPEPSPDGVHGSIGGTRLTLGLGQTRARIQTSCAVRRPLALCSVPGRALKACATSAPREGVRADQAGRMFALWRKRLSGSQVRLISRSLANRSGPNAAATRAAVWSTSG